MPNQVCMYSEELNKDFLFQQFLNYKNTKKVIKEYWDNCSRELFLLLKRRFKKVFNYFILLKLIKTATYYAATHYKARRQKQLQELTKEDSESLSSFDSLGVDTVVAHSKQMDSFFKHADVEEIKELLSELTSKQQVVIIMVVIEDIKVKDVAIKLGTSQQAVSKVKNSALNKLKKKIKDLKG